MHILLFDKIFGWKGMVRKQVLQLSQNQVVFSPLKKGIIYKIIVKSKA